MKASNATHRQTTRRSPAALCALLLTASVLAAWPFAEIGINDEFSYIRSAQTLAQTGHIAFYGWSSAMLGAQLALGALFIKLFGFSFTVARFSILLLAAATAFLLQRTAVRLGLTGPNATFATLALVLSPLFLPLAFSFMTDIAALFTILLALYLCLRAIQTESSRAATLWLLAATLAGAILGTARQTGWLGVLVLVPCTLWIVRRRKLPLLPLGLVWLACIAFIAAALRWFSLQLYTTREGIPRPGATHTLEVAAAFLRILLNLAFFLVPVLLAFLPALMRKNTWARNLVALATTLLAALLLLRPHSYAVKLLLAPSSAMGSYVTPSGLLDIPDIGIRPLVLAQPLRTILTLVIFAATLAFLVFLIQTLRSRAPRPQPTPNPTVSWPHIAILTIPLTCAYSLFLALRAVSDAFFDRYLLPLLALALLLALRLYQERLQRPDNPRMPAACYAALALYAAYAIASTHDLFAMERARIRAAAQLQAAGLPRTAFYAGFGFDGWTQIDAQGYVAAGGITLPPGAPPYDQSLERFRPCGYTLAHYFPAIRAQYTLSYDDTTCGQPTSFPPVPYRTWLPPRAPALYTRELPRTTP